MKANPDYWDPNLRPKVQKVTLKFITDTSTLTSALLSGEIDGAYEVPPTSIPALKSASIGKLYFGPSLSVSEVAISNPNGPYGKPAAAQGPLHGDRPVRPSPTKVYNGAAVPNKTLTPPDGLGPGSGRASTSRRTTRCRRRTARDIAAAKQIVASQPGADQADGHGGDGRRPA